MFYQNNFQFFPACEKSVQTMNCCDTKVFEKISRALILIVHVYSRLVPFERDTDKVRLTKNMIYFEGRLVQVVIYSFAIDCKKQSSLRYWPIMFRLRVHSEITISRVETITPRGDDDEELTISSSIRPLWQRDDTMDSHLARSTCSSELWVPPVRGVATPRTVSCFKNWTLTTHKLPFGAELDAWKNMYKHGRSANFALRKDLQRGCWSIFLGRIDWFQNRCIWHV